MVVLLSISGKLAEQIYANKSNSKMKSLYLTEYYLDRPRRSHFENQYCKCVLHRDQKV
jgi:hypothetical protein